MAQIENQGDIPDFGLDFQTNPQNALNFRQIPKKKDELPFNKLFPLGFESGNDRSFGNGVIQLAE